jgi:hypothetical protein
MTCDEHAASKQTFSSPSLLDASIQFTINEINIYSTGQDYCDGSNPTWSKESVE